MKFRLAYGDRVCGLCAYRALSGAGSPAAAVVRRRLHDSVVVVTQPSDRLPARGLLRLMVVYGAILVILPLRYGLLAFSAAITTSFLLQVFPLRLTSSLGIPTPEW